MYKFSRRSLDRLEGVDERLQAVARQAVGLSRIDFGIIQGLRSEAQQKELVARGASKTMKSKHLVGEAIDCMAYINGRASWELSLYDDIADAIKEAATIVGCPVRWGASWHIDDLRKWDGTMEEAMNSYIDLRRSQGRRPFIDGPHFELMD